MTVKELTIPVPWGHIAAKEYSNPPDTHNEHNVLALHGWMDNANTFDRLIPMLPGGNFVCMDFPGHGKSSYRPGGVCYSITDYVIDVARVVNELKWEKFSIMGHSLGGGIGILYSATFPEKVENLVVIDSIGPVTGKTEKFAAQLRESIRGHLDLEEKIHNGVQYSHEQALKRLLEGNSALTEESAKVLLQRGTREVEESLVFARDPRLKLTSPMSLSIDHVMNVVSNVKCPTLAVLAKDGLIGQFKEKIELFAKKLQESCSKFIKVEVEGNHFVHLNQPENVAPHIKNFLFSIDNAKL